jgi:hypothetical protein
MVILTISGYVKSPNPKYEHVHVGAEENQFLNTWGHLSYFELQRVANEMQYVPTIYSITLMNV